MKYLYSLLLLLSTFIVKAQNNVSWDFSTATPNTGIPVSNLTVSAVTHGNNNGTTTLISTTSASSGYAGASGTSNAGAACKTGAFDASTSTYFEVTLTPASGFTVNLSAINFGTRATSTGAQGYSVRTSSNSFSADAASGAITNNSTWALKSNTTNATSTSGTALVVRIYGYNGTGTPGAGTANWRIDDLFLTVTIASAGADITPPIVNILTPADNAVDVSASTNLTVVFNESVQKGTGNILLKKISDNSTVQTIDVTTGAVNVTANTAIISLTPLQLGTAYYVEIGNTVFKDLANNNFAGIAGNTIWNFTTSTSNLNALFNTCTTTIGDGFTQYSTTGAQVWGCTTFGYAGTLTGSAASAVQINGFASGTNVLNEDWLISPSINLVGTAFPLLSFYSRTAFNGAPLKLRVSTNYTGTGNPALATWTDLIGGFPLQASDVWKLSQNINLTAYKTANTYIAFVYNSTIDDGARWTVDNVKVENSLVPPPATLLPSTGELNFGFVAATTSLVKTMSFAANDILGAVNLTATGNFLISKTNGSFTPSISYTQAEANNIPQTVFVRFTPTAATVTYQGNLTFNTPSLLDTVITLKGNSIDAATTLDVVNWNVEWFGSTTLGPTNDNLQEQNVKTIMQNIGADVFALGEIISEPRLANIVSQLPGYSYVISNYSSYTNPNQPGSGPLSEAQKLAFVYKTAMFPGGLTTQPLLSAGINTPADITNPAYNWYASGRFPYMVTGTTTLNGNTKTIRFIVIHAKANTSPTLTSYARRKAGNDSLRTHLNTFYPNDNIIMLGDFNDDLDSTITAGINPKFSSYKQFLDDAASFSSPTLALSLSGKKSTVSYNDVIDHVMLSNEMQCSYLAGSAAILTDVSSLVSNYGSTTTDHYPVYTRYLFVQPSSATFSYAGSPYCNNAGIANVTFSGSLGGTFTSTPGLNINATSGAVNVSTSTAGTYTVTYSIAANACIPALTTTTSITTTAIPTASISYAGSPFCNTAGSGLVTLVGNVGGVYSSTSGLVINATTGEINTLTSTAGTYTITYTTAAAGGCAVTIATTSVIINATSIAPTLATASANTICGPNGIVTLTATGGTANNGAIYKWYAGSCGGIFVGSGAVLTLLTPNTTVTYFVRLEGGCNTTTCASVVVNVAAQPVITTSINPSIGLLPNAPIKIETSVTPAGSYTYSWTKNGAPITTSPSSTNVLTVYASEAGEYKVKATAITTGCSVTSAAIITPSVTDTKTLFIFPNPSSGIFNVAYNNGTGNGIDRTLSVYDSKGARVFYKTYSVNVPFGNMQVDLSNKGKGIYNVLLNDSRGNFLSGGLVEIL